MPCQVTPTHLQPDIADDAMAPRWVSNRIPGSSPFLEMDAVKQQARAKGHDIIDLSIGTPDLPPPPEALAALKVGNEVVGKQGGRKGGGSMGILL